MTGLSPEEASQNEALLAALRGGQEAVRRRALAKAITLLESTRADHRRRAEALLNACLPLSGRSLRLGISGAPGVGKSTFIEALGLHLIGLGHRVAVLAVDPSSSVSGGSILGDKTRMERLSVHPAAYIRPSPASGRLGGVAEHTRESILLCEAAGHDVVVVETVGVGQSEIAVAGMTDAFVLLQLPNAGDDLQAIKKGVMELADMVVINKADLDEDAATRARAQITSALRILGLHQRPREAAEAPAWQPEVMQLSALTDTLKKAPNEKPNETSGRAAPRGVAEFWQLVLRHQAQQTASGQFAARRLRQEEAWLWERIDIGLKAAFHHHPRVAERLHHLRAAVRAGEVAASVAANELLSLFALAP